MELLTLMTLVTSAIATFWGGCCNSGTYSSLSNTPIYSYYPSASSSAPSASPIYSFYSPTSSSVPSNLPVYSIYSTPSLSLQSSVPSGARIVTVSSPTSSFQPSDVRVVSVASPTYSYVPSGARIVSVSSPTSFVQSDARIISVSSPSSSFEPSDTRVVSVASPTFSYAPSGTRVVSVASQPSSFVSSNTRIDSFYSPISSSVPSGSPIYSVYLSNSPATTIWYPGALEFANRRLLQYYNGQDGRGQYDNYPRRNHLFVRQLRGIQRRSARHAQATIKPASPFASATEAPLVKPTGPPQGLISDIESEEIFHRQKMGPARPGATLTEDKPSEATVIRVLPPASATAMPSPAKPTGTPEELLRDIEELSHGNAQVERKRPSSPSGSSALVTPPDFRRLRLPGEDDEPSNRERGRHLRKTLH